MFRILQVNVSDITFRTSEMPFGLIFCYDPSPKMSIIQYVSPISRTVFLLATFSTTLWTKYPLHAIIKLLLLGSHWRKRVLLLLLSGCLIFVKMVVKCDYGNSQLWTDLYMSCLFFVNLSMLDHWWRILSYSNIILRTLCSGWTNERLMTQIRIGLYHLAPFNNF